MKQISWTYLHMKDDLSKLTQMSRALTSFELKIVQLKSRLHHLNQIINKKMTSINKFQIYYDEYKDKFNGSDSYNAHALHQSQIFLNQLTSVIFNENAVLGHLEAQKKELITEYVTYTKKISGMNQIIERYKMDKNNRIAKLLENEMVETYMANTFHSNTED